MVKALRIAMTSFQPVDNVSKGQIMEEELIQEEEVQQEEDPEEEVLEEEVQEEVVQWEEFLEVEFQEEEAQEEQQQILRGDLQQENDNLLTLQLHLHATPVEEAKLEERNAKSYRNGVDIPLYVAQYVPFVVIESNYTHLGHVKQYYPNSTMDEGHCAFLNKCTNLKKLYIISVNVSDFTDAHFRDNNFKNLEELRLESVHKHCSVETAGVQEVFLPLINKDIIKVRK
ncbi:hypothetical protein L5515_018210 [Caenorhabditis briggsae]|uniref:Uncharacterized protein n=1 Tax=Caenorhabditis briggsae TaxID=6238 RepID=A0AAE9JSC0_CAEBR|nr:hypothetical protein L5515_018210 [Caenorhabditis briggsae]